MRRAKKKQSSEFKNLFSYLNTDEATVAATEAIASTAPTVILLEAAGSIIELLPVDICFSFCLLKLRRLHLSDALAKCQARLGLMFIGGKACNASFFISSITSESISCISCNSKNSLPSRCSTLSRTNLLNNRCWLSMKQL